MDHSQTTALITNDAVVFGVLMVILAVIFYTSQSQHPMWKKFYAVVPALLLCYFIPGLLNTLGIVDGEHSQLYWMAKNYLLPTALVLLTLSIDLKSVLKLGPKALLLFIAGTAGVVLGGPLVLWIAGMVDPSLLGDGPESVWRGMATMAGSWIGGGANQAAMKEVFDVGSDVFGKFVAVDVIVANIWMVVLLFMAGRSGLLDARRGADVSAIDDLQKRIEDYQAQNSRIFSLTDLILILAAGFGATALAHACGGVITPFLIEYAPWTAKYSLTSGFFWIVVLATTFGLIMSFTRVRSLEGAGASKVGSAALYVLVATIGMHMDLASIVKDPELFVIGLAWISIHAGMMLLVARLLRAPVFFMAVGSQANIGGAASAPVVASAFNPALAPVGVLLAVCGYALGTYAAYICGLLLKAVAV